MLELTPIEGSLWLPASHGNMNTMSRKRTPLDDITSPRADSVKRGLRAQPRRYRKRTDLEQIILAGGRSLLRKEGLSSGVEHLSFKRVFDHVEATTGIKVANSSVIGRIWDDKSEFQHALLLSALDEDIDEELDESLAPVLPILESADRSTLESRWATTSELCRVAGAGNLDWITEGRTWPIWIGTWATSVTGDGNDERRRLLAERLFDNYERYTVDYEGIYAMVFDFLGFRMKEPLTVRQFAIAVGALAEGCGLGDMVDENSVRGIMLPTGSNGVDQEWSLFSIGLEALLHRFVEPIPRWRAT